MFGWIPLKMMVVPILKQMRRHNYDLRIVCTCLLPKTMICTLGSDCEVIGIMMDPALGHVAGLGVGMGDIISIFSPFTASHEQFGLDYFPMQLVREYIST